MVYLLAPQGSKEVQHFVQANKPVIGIVQDTLLGCRLMTKRDSFIKKDLFMNILMWLEDWDGRVPMPAILKPEPLWTGKQVINLIIPRVNLRRKAAWSKDHEDQDMTPYDSQVKDSISAFNCAVAQSKLYLGQLGEARKQYSAESASREQPLYKQDHQ